MSPKFKQNYKNKLFLSVHSLQNVFCVTDFSDLQTIAIMPISLSLSIEPAVLSFY